MLGNCFVVGGGGNGHHDAPARAGGNVYAVEAHAGAGHDAQLRHCRQQSLGDVLAAGDGRRDPAIFVDRLLLGPQSAREEWIFGVPNLEACLAKNVYVGRRLVAHRLGRNQSNGHGGRGE